MKTWRVTTDVLEARGSQVWQVEAETPEEACAKVAKGGGICVGEEIEVTSIGEPKPNSAEEVTE